MKAVKILQVSAVVYSLLAMPNEGIAQPPYLTETIEAATTSLEQFRYILSHTDISDAFTGAVQRGSLDGAALGLPMVERVIHISSLESYRDGDLIEQLFEPWEAIWYPVLDATGAPWAEMEILYMDGTWIPASFRLGSTARAVENVRGYIAHQQRAKGLVEVLPDVLIRIPKLGASFMFFREAGEDYLIPLVVDTTRVNLKKSQLAYRAFDVFAALRDSLQ